METRLHNIFKIEYVSNLTKFILESSYKFLLGTILLVTLKQPPYFLWAVKFLATFKLQIDITMVISIWRLKVAKNLTEFLRKPT